MALKKVPWVLMGSAGFLAWSNWTMVKNRRKDVEMVKELAQKRMIVSGNLLRDIEKLYETSQKGMRDIVKLRETILQKNREI